MCYFEVSLAGEVVAETVLLSVVLSVASDVLLSEMLYRQLVT